MFIFPLFTNSAQVLLCNWPGKAGFPKSAQPTSKAPFHLSPSPSDQMWSPVD